MQYLELQGRRFGKEERELLEEVIAECRTLYRMPPHFAVPITGVREGFLQASRRLPTRAHRPWTVDAFDKALVLGDRDGILRLTGSGMVFHPADGGVSINGCGFHFVRML